MKFGRVDSNSNLTTLVELVLKKFGHNWLSYPQLKFGHIQSS